MNKIIKNTSFKNAAYSKKYKTEYRQDDSLFLKKNRKESRNITLPYSYKIIKTKYINEVNLHGYYCILSDGFDNMIHQWRSYDNYSDFEKVITHLNGNHYLIYRQELYGYTVFDLTNRKEFQYFPQCVLDGSEDFIWTDVHYNQLNNLLAVTGCIWGAPYSTLLVDFFDPMTEPKFQINIIDCLPGSYDVYDDANFVRWDNQSLILNSFNTQIESKVEIIVTPEMYIQKIKNPS